MKRIPVILLGIAMAFVCGELVVRWYAPQSVYRAGMMAESCYRSDPTLYTTLKPLTRCHSSTTSPVPVYINSLGFRDIRDRPLQKATGVPRVLFIGDSYTFGYGVSDQESFPSLTEAYMKRDGKPVEVLNAGIPGVGPDWYYLFLKHKAFNFAPDLIVVNIYLGNDLFDHAYFDTTTRDSQGLPMQLGTNQEYVDADGTRKSARAPWQYTIPWLRSSHLFLRIAGIFGPLPQDTGNPHAINGSGCLLKPGCSAIDADIQSVVHLVSEMNRIAGEHNSKFVVTLLPWEAQLSRKLNEQSKGYLIPATKEQRHAVSDKIGALLEKNSIEYVDFLDAFDAYAGTEAVFTPMDYHWNAVGHRIAAEYLAPKLEAMLFPLRASETE